MIAASATEVPSAIFALISAPASSSAMAVVGSLLRRAKKTGVKPVLSSALTLAPWASSHLTLAVLPAVAAHISGVWFSTLAASMAAPLARIAVSTSGVVVPAQSAKAVVPLW